MESNALGRVDLNEFNLIFFLPPLVRGHFAAAYPGGKPFGSTPNISSIRAELTAQARHTVVLSALRTNAALCTLDVCSGICCAEPRRLYDAFDASMRVQNLVVYSLNKHTHRLQRHFPKAKGGVRYSAINCSLIPLCFRPFCTCGAPRYRHMLKMRRKKVPSLSPYCRTLAFQARVPASPDRIARSPDRPIAGSSNIG